MDDKDAFAIWLATTVLTAKGDPFGAAALDDLAHKANSTTKLDAGLLEPIAKVVEVNSLIC